jgi:hypothetical protein
MGRLIAMLLVGLVLGAVGVGAVLFYVLPPPVGKAATFGQFTGEIQTTFLDDGRTMRLDKDFAYVDPDGKIWLAPANLVIDGASIPQAFWTIIGGPFSGPYRNASVVHDAACVEKKEPSDDVHRMFYFACRCSGLEEAKAKAMYYAVAHFGPQWKNVYEHRTVGKATMRSSRPVDMVEGVELSEDQAQAILRYFEENNPALEEIPELEVVPGL